MELSVLFVWIRVMSERSVLSPRYGDMAYGSGADHAGTRLRDSGSLAVPTTHRRDRRRDCVLQDIDAPRRERVLEMVDPDTGGGRP